MTAPDERTEALERAFELCSAVLRRRPAALLTDIDGTISMIAPTPDSAFVEPAAIEALHTLTGRLEVVGAITGRAAVDAENMVGVPGMLYAGNHGFERRSAGVTVIDPLAASSIPAIADLLERVRFQAELAGVDEGMIFENKGVTGSIHYRLAHDQEAARVWLLPVISDLAAVNGLRISEGRLVIEIRPSARINKGTATRSIVEEHGIRGLVFLGDDITDLDAFRVGIDMRSAGLASVNVAVAAPESPPEVARLADVAIPGVETCVELLTMLADSNELGARDEEG